MIKTFFKQSGTIDELRETVNLCGKMYSGNFYNNLYEKDDKNVRAKSYSNNQVISLFRPEYIEIIQTESGELNWKAVEQLPDYKSEFDFHSSLGLFHSQNRGEFGGELITPKTTMHGNFGNIFEFNDKVYAIDTLNHMGIGHIRIYEFDKEINAHTLFKTTFGEWLSLSSLSIEKNRILILISGVIVSEKGSFSNRKPYSCLFEISENGFNKVTEFDNSFYYVNNILLKNNMLIIGMDKVVAFVDIETKEIRYFTPLTIEAENDIKTTEH